MVESEKIEWLALQIEVGRNVEDVGRQLRRKPPMSYEDLTHLIGTLEDAAETVYIIRNNLFE